MKQALRLVTAEGDHCEPLAKELEDHFRKANVLNVEGRKLKGGVDLLACLPSTLSKVRPTSNDITLPS
jgi:hypothetical protein